MKKNLWNWMLMAAVVLGLSMGVTSCSDDDDKDGRSAEEIAQDPYEKESEAGDALYRLASQLSVCDSLPNDWKTATFEPRLGQVLDQSQPRVRTITVANADEAVTRYNSLTGKNLPETTTSDTYTVDGVGTLTLTVGGAGTVATIDVNVKQMPQLGQLRMVTATSVGENGSFDGDPYYRFGDVVKDKEGHYWVCVRPAYSDNKKEDTHWMSFQVGDKNVKTYKKSKCLEQKYPVDLGVQKEKMQYFAQLLAILANPEGYKAEAGTAGKYFNKGTTGLGGLDEAAMPVEDLVAQAQLWEKYNVWKDVMPGGYDDDEVNDFKKCFKDNVRFIYEKGSTSGTVLTIQTVSYINADKFYNSLPNYNAVVSDMRDVDFDITNSYTGRGIRGKKAYAVDDAFVVRYKTGFQLSTNWMFDPKPTEAIPGVTDVHRFEARKQEVFGDATASTAKVGMIIGRDGKFYKDYTSLTNANVQPMALVMYVGPDADDSGHYHGLAMAYEDAGESSWDTKEDRICLEDTEGKEKDLWPSQMNGITLTDHLINDGHTHRAAALARNYSVPGFTAGTNGFSQWFLPSVGQVIKCFEGSDVKSTYKLTNEVVFGFDHLFYNVWRINIANERKFPIPGFFWTSTERNKQQAAAVHLAQDQREVEWLGISHSNKRYSDLIVRPVIAF